MMVSQNRRELILAAASRVFLEHGYRIASMTQVAEEAGISRQALYLAFASKQELFSAVIAQWHKDELAEIRTLLNTAASGATPAAKLTLALDVRFVRRYERIRTSPSAAELYKSAFEFANQATSQSAQEFDAILAGIIAPLFHGSSHITFTPVELAHLISTASTGFKVTASDPKQLQGSLRVLVSAILGSLGQLA